MAKHIDLQVKTLETKVANPMGMIYSNNSNQGVKILSMLKDMSDGIEKKKVDKCLKNNNFKPHNLSLIKTQFLK